MSANVSRIQVILDGAQARGEASKIVQSFQGMEKAAQSAGVSATVALQNYEREIASARVQIASLNQQYQESVAAQGRSSAASQALRAQIIQQSVATQGLVAEKRLLVIESRAEAAAQAASAAATAQATAVEQAALAATTSAWEKKTTRISTGKGVLAGYDSAIEGVVRAMGGINLGWAVGIGLLATLLPKILELISAKETIIKVDEDQLQLDSQRTDLNSRQIRTNADLTAAFRIIASEQSKYEAKTKELVGTMKLLETEGQRTFTRIDQGGGITKTVTQSTESLQKQVGSLNTELGEQEKVLKPAVDLLRFYRDANRLSTEQTLEFAKSMRYSGEQIEFFRVQLGEATTAQERYNAAILSQKAPGFSTEVTGGGFAKLVTDTTENLKASIAAGDAMNRAALSQGSALNQIKRILQETTLSQKGYREEVAKLPLEIQRGIVELDKISKGMKVFAENTKQTANAASNLQKELEQAKASVSGITEGSFEERRKKESAAYDDRIRDLKRNNQATEENLSLALQIYQVHYEKIKQDSTRAYLEIQDRLAAIQGKGLDSEFNRHKAMIDKQVNDDIEAMRKAGLDKNQITAFTILFRKAREEEFNVWLIDQNNKTIAVLTRGAEQLAKTRAQIEKQAQKESQTTTLMWLKEQTRFEKQQMNEVLQLRKHLLSTARPGGLTDDQSFKLNLDLDADIKKLDALGISANDVDKYFGFASQSVEQFHARVELLTSANASAIDSLSQMVDWSAVLTSGIQAFTSAIAGAIAGTDSLGHALLVGFFNIIGMIAIQLGTLFILAAAGFAFIPGLNWSAGALAAAGIAMLAFGAVMTGLAAKFSQKDKGASGASASGGGASSGSGASDRQPPTSVVSFPTSGAASSGGMGAFSFRLDKSGTKDFLEGAEVVVMGDLQGRGSKSTQVRRHVRKMASQPA